VGRLVSPDSAVSQFDYRSGWRNLDRDGVIRGLPRRRITTELRLSVCEAAMPTLAQRPCIPCRGGAEPLTREQCAAYLIEVSAWELVAAALTKRFQFRDYRAALAFANAVSALAEEIWHHPELTLGWGLFRDIVDHAKNRRFARIRFRYGGAHKCTGIELPRFSLAVPLRKRAKR
jgi:4a-hydroxytetrahydrobiopterin dehydratase